MWNVLSWNSAFCKITKKNWDYGENRVRVGLSKPVATLQYDQINNNPNLKYLYSLKDMLDS